MSATKAPQARGKASAWNFLRFRPRLYGCALLGLVVAYLLPADWAALTITRVIIGWNVGTWTYLAMTGRMMFTSTHEKMRRRAIDHDEGKMAVLAFVVIAAMVCLGAIVNQLGVAKGLHGSDKYLHIALAGLTLLSSWSFTHVMFALHYAHDYYSSAARGQPGGLDFPGEDCPDYGDFLYFAAIIGTSGQTADVTFNARFQRRTGLVHCVLAFYFNATLLALTINIASSLL